MQPNASRNAPKRSRHRSFTAEILECRTLLSAWGTVDDYQLAAGKGAGGFAMATDAAGNVYAVGVATSSAGTVEGIVREKLSGSTSWTTIEDFNAVNERFTALAIDAAGDIYVGGAGTYNATSNHWIVLEKPAGGSSFSVVDSYVTTGPGIVFGLAIDGTGNVFAAGWDEVTTSTGSQEYWTVRKQTGGKGAFTTVDNYAGAHAYGVTAIAAGPSAGIYVVGQGESSANPWLVRKSTNGGATWSVVDSRAGGAAFGVAGDGAGNVYVVGDVGGIWQVRKSVNGGASWSTVDNYQLSAGNSAFPSAIGTDLAGNVYVVGRATDAAGTHSIIRTNAGGSWATVDNFQLLAGKAAVSLGFTADPTGALYTSLNAADATSSHWLIRSVTPGSVAGVVFADANANGKQDPSDKGTAGRKVYLDLNRNGKFDTGEPTTLTAVNGTYHFAKLSPGRYQVREVQPAGWRGTAPATGYFDVVLKAGQALTGESFGQTQMALISGVVFKDINGNGKQDATDAGLVGWTVFLDTNNNGKLDAGERSVLTDAKGNYSFVVPAGKYYIREVLKAGFHRITPSSGVYAITLTAAQIGSGKNFAND